MSCCTDGTVSFWDDNTTWMAEAATQIDYFVTVPPASAMPASNETRVRVEAFSKIIAITRFFSGS